MLKTHLVPPEHRVAHKLQMLPKALLPWGPGMEGKLFKILFPSRLKVTTPSTFEH